MRCSNQLAADLRNAYTPSFSLLGAESLILEQSDIGGISNAIKDCLRCGKCKPVCATHVPRANLLYSPRNKILATSLLADLGARVIKIEPLRGDPYRLLAGGTTDDPVLNLGHNNMARAQQGKQSIALNLKDERGQAILRGLIDDL